MAYIIKKGDNLTRIAQQNGVSLDDILRDNPNITNPDRIFEGATLNIPSRVPSPSPTPTPGAPAPNPTSSPAPDYAEIAKSAGASGMTFKDFESFLGATPEEQKTAKDSLAKQFGYEGYDSFLTDVFAKPSKNTQQFYEEAFKSAGLEDRIKEIDSKKKSLNEAIGTVNANPWYTEAYRRGEAARLQELADGDIKNILDDYTLRHEKVKELVSRYSTDIGNDDKLREAKFKYLESAASQAATAAANKRTAQYLTDFAKGKRESEIPKTVTAPDGSAIYQWDEATKSYKLLKAATTTNNSLGGLTKDQRAYLNQIQDNARQDKNISEFPAVRASYETARSAAAKNDGAGDIVLMRMIAKITDPTTGVREEEFRTFEGAQSVLARYGVTLTKKMWAGDRLTAEGRAQLLGQAQDIYNQREAAYKNSYDFFDRQATGADIPSGLVMPLYTAPTMGQSGNTDIAAQIHEARQYYKPAEILTFLGGKDPALASKIAEAKKNGYKEEDILDYLSIPQTVANPNYGKKNPAQRNNNPGNLKDPRTGQFQTFKTPEAGFRALQNDLNIKISGRSSTGLTARSTLRELIAVWAPSSDNNDPENYAGFVAKKIGVSPNTPIGQLKSKLPELAKAIAQFEGYYA